MQDHGQCTDEWWVVRNHNNTLIGKYHFKTEDCLYHAIKERDNYEWTTGNMAYIQKEKVKCPTRNLDS